jgi:hypothetical protein
MVDDEPDLTMPFKLGLEDNGFESSHCTECLQGEAIFL